MSRYRDRDERYGRGYDRGYEDEGGYGGSSRRGYGGYGGGRDYTHEGRRAGRDFGEGDYDPRDYRGDYAGGYDREDYGGRYERGHVGGYERRGESGRRDYDERPESLMGGGTTGYDPNYAGYGTGRGGYSGDYGRGYGRDYDYDREERGFRVRGRGARESEEGRGWWNRASDEVASWFGDEEAARRRLSDEQRDRSRHGEGGHRGRGPKGYRRSDERIREDVSDRLSDHPYLDASEIEVEVSGGEVTLSGIVDNRHAKRLAEDLAESVSGVTNVENRIRVNRGERVATTGDALAGESAAGATPGATSGSAASEAAATGPRTGGGTT